MGSKATKLQREILIATGRAGHRLWNNPRGFDAILKIMYGVGPNGASDLMGITATGRFAAIEVKADKDRPTNEQKRFIDFVRSRGGVAGFARSVEDALRILAE